MLLNVVLVGCVGNVCCDDMVDVVEVLLEGILLLGCMLGVLTACLMVTMAGCLICPQCPAYRRRRVIKHKSESSILSRYPGDS